MLKFLILLYLAQVKCESSVPNIENDNLDIKAFTWASFITPREGKYNISEQCIKAGDNYLDELGNVFVIVFGLLFKLF